MGDIAAQDVDIAADRGFVPGVGTDPVPKDRADETRDRRDQEHESPDSRSFWITAQCAPDGVVDEDLPFGAVGSARLGWMIANAVQALSIVTGCCAAQARKAGGQGTRIQPLLITVIVLERLIDGVRAQLLGFCGNPLPRKRPVELRCDALEFCLRRP